jgi:hypothetical protein
MHGRLHHVIVDCPDPGALANFYSTLLNEPITYVSDDFVVAANETTSGIAFQRVPDHRAPTWPDSTVPQQLHFDVMVEDVFADPAGHPFCLIKRPAWADPIPD